MFAAALMEKIKNILPIKDPYPLLLLILLLQDYIILMGKCLVVLLIKNII